MLVSLSLNDQAWASFVGDLPQAHLFHHPGWAACLAESYGYAFQILAVPGVAGRLAAGLPVARLRAPFGGSRLVSLPYTDHCRPLAREAAALEALVDGLPAWRARAGHPPLEVRAELPGSFALQPAGVLHELDLARTPEDLLAGCSKMHRRSLRKAQQAGLAIEHDTSLAGLRAFYRLHTLTRQRLGVPTQPWRFFEALWRHLIQPGLGFVLLARHQGQPCAGAVFLGWNGTLVYKFGASDPAFWPHRPNHLLFWTAITWGAAQGYRRLDFGRTDLESHGLREFKAHWGAKERPLTYAYLGRSAPARHQGPAGQVLRRVIRGAPPVVGRVLGDLLYGRFV